MNVLYVTANKPAAIMQLDALIATFREEGAINNFKSRYGIHEEDIRANLGSLGWYEGLNDFGRFLILDFAKVGLAPEDVGSTKCRHRDDGRGRCIDCGEFI